MVNLSLPVDGKPAGCAVLHAGKALNYPRRLAAMYIMN